jgi:SAM-dependent methyltransferase
VYEKLLEGPLFYNFWSSFHFTPRFRALKEGFEGQSNPRILDLGCGTGLFKKYFPVCDYFGIDNNPRYIEYARQRLPGTFVLGDILDLNRYITDQKFDYIILNGVLHHMDNIQVTQLVKTLSSFLSESGRILVVDHIFSEKLNPINKMLLSLDRGSFSRTVEEYQRLFEHYRILSFRQFYIQAGPLILWTQARFVLANH